MLNQTVENYLNLAFAYAIKNNHAFVTCDHLLFCLLENNLVQDFFSKNKISITEFKEQLSQELEKQSVLLSEINEQTTQPSPDFQRVLQRAVLQAHAAKQDQLEPKNLFLSILYEVQSIGFKLFSKKQINHITATQYFFSTPSNLSSKTVRLNQVEVEENALLKQTYHNASDLELVSTNLTQLHKSNPFEPLIGREEELNRILQIFCKRRKNHVLLLGEAGVGKTALVEGLAAFLDSPKVPFVLRKCQIISLDLSALLAGTRYRGDFEKRLRNIFNMLETKGNVIVFIDEIHTIIGAGSSANGQLDAANLIKPRLARGNIRFIGATTYKEYSNIFEKDKALARRFQKVVVEEPSIEMAVKILKGIKSNYEKHHKVKYSSEAIKAAVELSKKYIHDRCLPDTAIDVLDEAGASTQQESPRKKISKLDAKDINKIISFIAKIPETLITEASKLHLKRLPDQLKSVIFGQNEAIDQITDAIHIHSAGLSSQKKPIGSFLLAGPTGVGKTEVAVQLAKGLSRYLLRFDMSEYMEKHAVNRLIGAPPGYVGFDQNGLLTDAILKKPQSILLLDEIEKAHPELLNLFLQVMDHGTLTDSVGRLVDFRQVILIMTTNVGASEYAEKQIGFSYSSVAKERSDEALQQFFSPEFRNRLDKIIWFHPLSEELSIKIANKFVNELRPALQKKRVKLVVTASAMQWIAKRGCSSQFGARYMERVVQKYLKQPLAREILFGKLTAGGKMLVDHAPPASDLHYEFNPDPVSIEDQLEEAFWSS